MGRNVRKRTFWHMRPTEAQISLLIPHSDQSLRCPHEVTLHSWLSKLRPVKFLISDSSLGIRSWTLRVIRMSKCEVRKYCHTDQCNVSCTSKTQMLSCISTSCTKVMWFSITNLPLKKETTYFEFISISSNLPCDSQNTTRLLLNIINA